MAIYSGNRPAFLSLMLSLPDRIRGTVLGIQATSNRLGQALGSAIGGLLLSWMDYSYLGIFCIVLSVFATTVCLYGTHYQ